MRSPTTGRWWPLSAPVVLDLAALDRSVYGAVAATPTPALDGVMRRLSAAADHSKLSFAVAGLLALRGGSARRAAVLGVAAIGLASATANLLGKNLVRRERPDRAGALVPEARHVPMPSSASFPSGHSASAFAFAVAVGAELPSAAVPLALLAATVAYSRVHTGVHYPGDVVAGSLLGVAAATTVRLVGVGTFGATPRAD